MNRAAGRCEHRARLLQVLLGDRAQTVAVCGILSRSRPCCCTRRCCRCRYSVRCSSSAVPLAPSACPCCCNGTRSAEPICISANCAAAGAQFFPASGRCPGEHRRTGWTLTNTPMSPCMVPMPGTQPLAAGVCKKRDTLSRVSFLEAPPGFEPGVKDLQSHALPLGYGAKKMERATRFELATSTLARWRSAK